MNKIRRLSCLFCAVLFLVLGVAAYTYAWNSEQQATNDIFGKKDVKVPVELVKLEKGIDGVDSQIVLADTEFLLFKESGKQIGGRYVTDENGMVNVSLTAGKYYFEEFSPSVGYTYDTDENGEPITRYPFTVTDKSEKIVVTAYNKQLTGNLLVRKTVKNSDGSPLTDVQKNTEFTFIVTFSDGNSYPYSVNGGEEQTLASDGTLKLRSGDTAEFDGITYGVLYDVVEVPAEGYIIKATGHRGNITEEQAIAEFVNIIPGESTSELGSLTVTKELVGENADYDKEFTFTIALGGVTESFSLKHGESKSFSGLPIGTEFIVTEQDYTSEGYIPTVKEYSGQIVGPQEVKLPFVNAYDEQPEDKFGSLTVTKEVIGDNIDEEKQFTFSVEFFGEGAPEAATFVLKNGENKSFVNIPYGVTYTVSETDAAGYDAVLHEASGNIAGDITCNIPFTNIVPDDTVPDEKVKLSVTKILSRGTLEFDKDKEFAFTLIVDGEKTEFTLKVDETKEFEVPVGAVYEIEEADYFAEGFTQLIVDGFGTVTTEQINVKAINTTTAKDNILISGEKTWDKNGFEDLTLPDSITIQLKNGDLVIEEATITPDENGAWKYSFTVPKYNGDGTLANYVLSELPVTSYRASYDGYNIKNTYVDPEVVEAPVITKVIQGDEAPTTKFDFVFKGKDNAPMPEGSVGNRKQLTLTDSGKLSVGNITFTDPGEYVYTVHEVDGGIKGWKYDEANYVITFTVTEEDHELSAEYSIKRNDSSTDEVVFTNTFDESELGENIIINGEKTWVHKNNPESERPASIVVKVYGDGELVAQKNVTANNNWRYSFELPKFAADGSVIVYSVDEEAVKDYVKQIDGYDITNTYSGTDTPSDDSPPTGDDASMLLWLALMLFSFAGIIVSRRYVPNKDKSGR